MCKNTIYYISQEEAESKIQELKLCKDIHVAIVNGKRANTWKQYLKQIETLYRFPTSDDNFDGYVDWMQDLSWIEQEGFALFIWDYDDFMSRELDNKKLVMSLFLDQILPWWQRDIKLYCKDGKPKEFNVYLVNS